MFSNCSPVRKKPGYAADRRDSYDRLPPPICSADCNTYNIVTLTTKIRSFEKQLFDVHKLNRLLSTQLAAVVMNEDCLKATQQSLRDDLCHADVIIENLNVESLYGRGRGLSGQEEYRSSGG